MQAIEWAKTVTSEDQIQQAVLNADFGKVVWCSVDLSRNGVTASIDVGAQPLSIGDADSLLFVPVTARTAQRLAEKLGFSHPTARLMNVLWKNAKVRVPPVFQPSSRNTRLAQGFSPSMRDLEASMRFTRDCINLRRNLTPSTLGLGRAAEPLAVPYKVWALTNRAIAKPQSAFNYGMFSEAGAYRGTEGDRLLQPLSGAHNFDHWDYSQVMLPVKRVMTVNGQLMNVSDVLASDTLWSLLSDEGPIRTSLLLQETPPVPQLSSQWGTSTRTLRRGMIGPDVAELQRRLKLRDDGNFGPMTEAALKNWQRSVGLTPDGVYGAQSRAKLNEQVESAKTSSVQLLGRIEIEDKPLISSFRQAKHFKAVSAQREIRNITLHSAEIDTMPTGAEALGAYAATMTDGRVASWHAAIDSDSIVQSVRWEDIAFHAPGLNEVSIGLEFSGRARATETQWLEGASREMLELGAKLVATLCLKFNIPPTFIDAEGLKRNERGITTHAEVTAAFKRSTHTDPGKGFPMKWFLEEVSKQIAEVRS